MKFAAATCGVLIGRAGSEKMWETAAAVLIQTPALFAA